MLNVPKVPVGIVHVAAVLDVMVRGTLTLLNRHYTLDES